MGATTDDPPSRDEAFDLLNSHRRRYTIRYCKQQDGPVTLSELAEQVAAWEQETPVEELTSAERKRVYTSLQQTHLPTLDDAGMIDYEDGTIELTDRARNLDGYLAIVPGDSVPWDGIYLGLSVVGFAVLAGVWLGVLPTEPVSALGWGALVVATFAVSAVVHVYRTRRSRPGSLEAPP